MALREPGWRTFQAQATAVLDALDGLIERAEAVKAFKQWRFKPYLRNGKAVEIETGAMFGDAQR